MTFVFGNRASFWICAAIVAHTLWTSAAPAMTYPLYAMQWGLTTTITAAIFAIYPITVVFTLILFSNLPELFGTRKTMLAGLAGSIAGVFLFVFAANLFMLFAGRILWASAWV
jgi:MFS family permease